MPEPSPKFSLDYDFDKYSVQGLATIFQRPKWEISDAITAGVKELDPSATSMYDTGGRSSGERHRHVGMDSRWHGYGHQLGFHALSIVAAEALATYPVVEKPYTSDPWQEWLNSELLTRGDGLWLSDGTDRPPLDTQLNLMEKGASTTVITGSKTKILGLIGITPMADEIVVGGDWQSYDNISVHVSSALVSTHKARTVAQLLVKEDPFRAWLPDSEEYEGEDHDAEAEKEDCVPWIVWPSAALRLDQMDPLGAGSSVRRLRFSRATNEAYLLTPADAFGRSWKMGSGPTAARSEAWRYRVRDEREFGSARRLICRTSLLRRILTKQNADLLLLIILRRYQSRGASRDGEFWHTTAVVRLTSALKVDYLQGAVNKLHEMNE